MQARFKNTNTPIQRMVEEEEEEENLLQAKFKHLTNLVQRKDVEQKESSSNHFSQSLLQKQEQSPKNNPTGLPDNLKSGIENLSGYSMNDVKVHYNSSKPAQLQAHAFAQGTDIHIASGQEKHLPHEAWHVVQQKQGRVKQTTQLKEVGLNEDASLEREADVMGGKAANLGLTGRTTAENPSKTTQLFASISNNIVQRAKRFTPVTYVDDDYERGHKMEATDLNINNIGGGSETAGIAIGGSNRVNHYKATQGSPFCVQMHLLNRKLGGNGRDSQNLGWGSSAMNGQHKYKIENFLNRAIEEHEEANNNQQVIDYYRVRVDYYQPTDNSNRERAKGAMIEKLYYEAKYRPNPGAVMQTEKGMLEDASGISQMDNLVQNIDSMDDEWANHVPNDVHLTYKEDVDLRTPNVYTSDQQGLVDYYENIDSKIAATTRKPQPPKPIAYKCEKRYEKVEGQLRNNFDGVYDYLLPEIEEAAKTDAQMKESKAVSLIIEKIHSRLEAEARVFLRKYVIDELAKSDDRLEAMDEGERDELVRKLQEGKLKEDLKKLGNIIIFRADITIYREQVSVLGRGRKKRPRSASMNYGTPPPRKKSKHGD